MKEVDVLIIHEKPDLAFQIASRLTDNDIFALHDHIDFASSLSMALNQISKGLRPKTIIFHKGLGDQTPLQPFIDGIRAVKGGDIIRFGIVSGEFYGGTVCKTALELGANFGWDFTENGLFDNVPDWVVSMTKLGYLHPPELELQGKEIILSELQTRDRLKLLGVTSAPSFLSPVDRDRF